MLSGSCIGSRNVPSLGEVKLRYLEMRHTADLLDLMNSLVEEEANIRYRRMLEFDEQVDWVAEQLKKIEKGKRVQVVVEVGDKALGSCSVGLDDEAKDHVGSFGIVLGKEIRGFGLGEWTMRKVLEEAEKTLDVEVVVLKVYDENEVAKSLYEKLGFEEVGRIRDGVCLDGRYQDVVIMEKFLTKHK